MLNSSDEKTPMQVAQERLLAAAGSTDGRLMAPTAYINGILMSARLSALIEMVGMNSPEFQKLYDATILTHLEKLAEQLKAQNVKPKIQLALAN